MSLNLRGTFVESVNILKSVKQCQQNENSRWPTSCWDKNKSLKLIPGDIAETYESCKFPEDQRKFLVT